MVVRTQSCIYLQPPFYVIDNAVSAGGGTADVDCIVATACLYRSKTLMCAADVKRIIAGTKIDVEDLKVMIDHIAACTEDPGKGVVGQHACIVGGVDRIIDIDHIHTVISGNSQSSADQVGVAENIEELVAVRIGRNFRNFVRLPESCTAADMHLVVTDTRINGQVAPYASDGDPVVSEEGADGGCALMGIYDHKVIILTADIDDDILHGLLRYSCACIREHGICKQYIARYLFEGYPVNLSCDL